MDTARFLHQADTPHPRRHAGVFRHQQGDEIGLLTFDESPRTTCRRARSGHLHAILAALGRRPSASPPRSMRRSRRSLPRPMRGMVFVISTTSRPRRAEGAAGRARRLRPDVTLLRPRPAEIHFTSMPP